MATERFEIVIDVRGLNQANQQFRQLGQQTRQAQRHVQEFQSTLRFLRGALVAFASAKIAGSFLEFADTLTSIRNRLSQVTETTGGMVQKQKELFDIARRSRTALESVAILYTRTALSADNLTQSQAELLKFTELTTKATAASGATASEAKNGLIQLAQGIASNRLGGDELRSVLENLTGVSLALAAGLGVTRGELRKLAEQGGLTSDVIVKAILSQEELIEKLFAETVPTIGQAFEVMKSSLIQALGAFDNATGTLRVLAGTILLVADNMNAVVATAVFFASRMVLVAADSRLVAIALAGIRTAALGAAGGLSVLLATFTATRAASGLLTASLVTMRTVIRSLFGPAGIALALFGLMEFRGGASEADLAVEHLSERMTTLKKSFDEASMSIKGMTADVRIQEIRKVTQEIDDLGQALVKFRDEQAEFSLNNILFGGTGTGLANVGNRMQTAVGFGQLNAFFNDVDAKAYDAVGSLVRAFKPGISSATEFIEELEKLAKQADGPTRKALQGLIVSFQGMLEPQLQAEKGLRDATLQLKILSGAATEADFALAGFIKTAGSMSDAEILESLSKTDPLIKARNTAATENPVLQVAIDRNMLPGPYGRAQIDANNSAVERLSDPLGFQIKQEQERLNALRASSPMEKAVAEAQRLKLNIMEKGTQEQIKQLALLYQQEDALNKSRREAESDASRMEKQYKKTRGALEFELSSLQGITGEAAAIARAKSKIADFDELSATKQKEILGIALQIDRLESRRALNPVERAKAELAKAQAQIEDLSGSGTIGPAEAASMLAAQTEQYREALNPLKYFNDEMDRELALMGLSDKERQIAITTRNVLLNIQQKSAGSIDIENKAIREQVELTVRRNALAEDEKVLLKELQGDTEKYAERMKELLDIMGKYPAVAEQATRAMIALRIEQLQFNTDIASGFERGALRVLQEFTDASELAAQAVTNAFSRTEDALVSLITKFDASGFKEMVQGLNEDLIRTFVREGVMKPLATALFGDLIGGSFGAKPDGSQAKPFYVSVVNNVIPGATTGGGGGGILGGLFGKIAGAFIGSSFSLANGGGMPAGGWDLSGLPVNNDFSSTLTNDLAGFARGGSFTVGSRSVSDSLDGVDNRMVRFRARDGETVTVSPPGESPGGGNTYITMNVSTPDAASFAANQGQIMANLYSTLARQSARNN